MAIMSALVLYIVPGLIGRAYDLKNETVGPDLFTVENVKHARVIDRHLFTSEYRIVTDESEAADFLDVTGKLTLKIKTGAIDVKGSGEYLKETTSFQNKVEMLVKVHYETVTEVLPSDTEPVEDWYRSVEKSSYTHYIRSIQYGGELLASVSFITKNEGDREKIKATIEGEMNAKSGSFGGSLKGNLDKINNETKNSARMEINYFATVPLKNVPRTIDGLISLVDEFPKLIKEVNEGKGVPLKMEVLSLESLKQDFVTYYQTLALTDMMTILDEQLTDFRNARRKLSEWFKTVPPVLPESETARVGEFASKLEHLNALYSKVIGNLDLSHDATPEQFYDAFHEYDGVRGYPYPDMYVRELVKLRRDILKNTPSFEDDFGGAHYTHWGSHECINPSVSILQGIMTGSDRNTVGTAQFSCLSQERHFYPDEELEHDDHLHRYPHMQPIVFVSRRGSSHEDRLSVHCATCRIPGKTAVTMIPGYGNCPEQWSTVYGGVLVSTDSSNARGQLICMDVDRHDFEKVSSYDDLTVITEASPHCGEFPCHGRVNDRNAVPCVVCSIRKEDDIKVKVSKE